MKYNFEENIVHYGLLYKIHKLKGEVLYGQEMIKGKKGSKGLEPDEIVSKKHMLHDLIRGFYKPRDAKYLLSCQVTESEENYGEQIQWEDKDNRIFNHIVLKPPSGEKDVRKKSDIEAAEYSMNNEVPIGIFLKISKGVNECLGLGIIREKDDEGNYIVYPYDMEFDYSVFKQPRYFTFRTNNSLLVDNILDNNIQEFVFDGISNYYEDMKLGDVVFIVLGGDRPEWNIGLRGICTISRAPYDKGYDNNKLSYFKINLKKELIFSNSITKEQMVPYRDTYNMVFIGPMLKGEPNQANVKAERQQVVAVIKAIIDIYKDYKDRLIQIFGEGIIREAENVDIMESVKVQAKYTVDSSFSDENAVDTIQHIHKYINSKGYIISIKALSNLYLSLKTKPFVILSGISGTGKSKLIRLFAEAIGATSDNGQYSLISVQPDWNDSTEILGYKNISDEFVPGRLAQIIREAAENKARPYIVCLDEMNLARVEYYLSEYLSIIETREITNNKEIITKPIFPRGHLPEGNPYSTLSFPDNIYLIGTVNIDDTTFSFSRKVLDRANTIEFSEVNLSELNFNLDDIQSLRMDNSFLKTRILSIKEALQIDQDYVRKVNNEIIKLNNILLPYSKHFGYRVRDEIVFYMLENRLLGLIEEELAFDYQIMQKILPTILGSDDFIKDILIKLYNYCLNDTMQLNPDGDYVKEAEDNLFRSKYKLSAYKVCTMLRGFRDGYTTFWL